MIYFVVPVLILALSGFLMGRYQIGPMGSGIKSSWPWFLTQALAVNAIVVLGGALGRLFGLGPITYDIRKIMLYLGVFIVGMVFQITIALAMKRRAAGVTKAPEATQNLVHF